VIKTWDQRFPTAKPLRSYHAESMLYHALTGHCTLPEAALAFFDHAYNALAQPPPPRRASGIRAFRFAVACVSSRCRRPFISMTSHTASAGCWTSATTSSRSRPAFHDLEAFRSLDYLAPFDPSAVVIAEHHRLTPYKGPHAHLAEPFHKADLIDVSQGLIRAGLP
jgi:hypothetical protein